MSVRGSGGLGRAPKWTRSNDLESLSGGWSWPGPPVSSGPTVGKQKDIIGGQIKPLLRCQGVLFDLDGVLVDSAAVVERTWRKWTARHGLVIPDIVRRSHGRRSIDTLRDLAPALPLDAEVEWLEATELSDMEGLVALPGALEAFGSLPGNRRAIVTSGGRALALMRLGATGFPTPEVLVAAENVGVGKPSPEGYELAAARLGIDPHECVVIEDTPAGISAGRAAGARTVALTTTLPASALADADMIVPSLASIRIAQHDHGIEIA